MVLDVCGRDEIQRSIGVLESVEADRCAKPRFSTTASYSRQKIIQHGGQILIQNGGIHSHLISRNWMSSMRSKMFLGRGRGPGDRTTNRSRSMLTSVTTRKAATFDDTMTSFASSSAQLMLRTLYCNPTARERKWCHQFPSAVFAVLI